MERFSYRVLEMEDFEMLVIVFDEEKYSVLATFLESDVIPFEEWIKSDFDRVLSGQSDYWEINGNICHVEIKPDQTKVFDNLVESDEEYFSTCCEVDTKELRQLIDEWCDKVREFKSKRLK